MADDDEKPALDPQPRRRVPPPTIDLAADEVPPAAEAATEAKPEAAKSDTPADQPADPAANPSADPAPEPEQPAGSTGAAEPPRPPRSERPAAESPRAQRRSAGGSAALASGAIGAVLALIAAGAAWTVFGPGRERFDATDARLARIEAALAAVPKAAPPSVDPHALAELSRRLGDVETALAHPPAPAPAPAAQPPPAPDPALADLRRRLDETAAAARAAQQRADAAAKSASEAAKAAEAAHAPAPAAAADSQETKDTIKDISQDVTKDLTKNLAPRADVDALASRLARLEADQKDVADRLGQTASKSEIKREIDIAGAAAVTRANAAATDARAAVAALALELAVEHGGPYTRELAALDQTRADKGALGKLAPFASSGVPSTAMLAQQLDALLPAARAAAEPTAPANGLLDRLKADAARLVRVRPIGTPAGDDPAAVLARLETAATHANLAAARADAEKLPPAARAPLDPWIKQVAAREGALAAASALVAHALDALRTSSVPGAQGVQGVQGVQGSEGAPGR